MMIKPGTTAMQPAFFNYGPVYINTMHLTLLLSSSEKIYIYSQLDDGHQIVYIDLMIDSFLNRSSFSIRFE